MAELDGRPKRATGLRTGTMQTNGCHRPIWQWTWAARTLLALWQRPSLGPPAIDRSGAARRSGSETRPRCGEAVRRCMEDPTETGPSRPAHDEARLQGSAGLPEKLQAWEPQLNEGDRETGAH